MKVVINQCYGGFGLSSKALIRLIEADSKSIIRQSTEEYGAKESLFTQKCRDGYSASWISVCKNRTVYFYDNFSVNARIDPTLIQIIEEIGNAANGPFAKLKIVEIPDDVTFVIEEYDGMETIAEVHRIWS